MRWFVAIIEAIVRGLFRSSPEERQARRKEKAEAQYQRDMVEWKAQEQILEVQRDKAKLAYEAYVTGHSVGSTGPGELMRLHESYRWAAEQLNTHRSRQSRRLPD